MEYACLTKVSVWLRAGVPVGVQDGAPELVRPEQQRPAVLSAALGHRQPLRLVSGRPVLALGAALLRLRGAVAIGR